MRCERINIKETNVFSNIFIDYINQDPNLKPFYDLPSIRKSFQAKIEKRKFDDSKRQILHDVLNQQYSGFSISKNTASNIARLKENNTYTITTGHQLNIFTGPLYFVYKIIIILEKINIFF